MSDRCASFIWASSMSARRGARRLAGMGFSLYEGQGWDASFEQYSPKLTEHDPKYRYSTAAVTLISPRSIMCSAWAAANERSRTRPLLNGPRSLTVTYTLRWLFGSVTRRRVPKGSVRWAAVNFFPS